ncbi:MAG: hypothetical protein ACOY4Q_08845 [Bacillota bacterium]
MVSMPCFASCVHAKDGDCHLNVISNHLAEMECQCPFFKRRNNPTAKNSDL